MLHQYSYRRWPLSFICSLVVLASSVQGSYLLTTAEASTTTLSLIVGASPVASSTSSSPTTTLVTHRPPSGSLGQRIFGIVERYMSAKKISFDLARNSLLSRDNTHTAAENKDPSPYEQDTSPSSAAPQAPNTSTSSGRNNSHLPTKSSQTDSSTIPRQEGASFKDPCTLIQGGCLIYALQKSATHVLYNSLPLGSALLGSVDSENTTRSSRIDIVILALLLGILLRILSKYYLKYKTEDGFITHIANIHLWLYVNIIITFILALYGVIIFLEAAGATGSTVEFQITNSSVSMSCTSSVSLGTITEYGDTGPSSVEHMATCLVYSVDASGYSLRWQASTGSGGTATGKLVNEFNNTIDPYRPATAGIPELWSVSSTGAAWGARLSSTSSQVSTGTWGVDAVSEKWLNVSTGGTVIASRNSPTTVGSPDSEKIAFRAEIGAEKEQPVGTYRTTVLLTVLPN